MKGVARKKEERTKSVLLLRLPVILLFCEFLSLAELQPRPRSCKRDGKVLSCTQKSA